MTESNSLIRVSEKINKGIKSLEKDENNNMIRILSYIAKINDNKNESNSLLITLMKNLEMGFQEEQTNVKYEEYFFNGIQSPKNIQIKDIKIHSATITWDIDDININNYDEKKLKYRIELREKIKGEKFNKIYEGDKKEFLIEDLKKNSTYEIKIYSIYEDLISEFIFKSFDSFRLDIDSNILSESKRLDEFIEKIYEWCGYTNYELLIQPIFLSN